MRKSRHFGVLVGLIVGLFLASGLAVVYQPAEIGSAAPRVANPQVGTAATPTLTWQYTDFFNVPYGEWWDYRYTKYGDLPINAECFNATSITDGVCIPSDPTVPDVATYPYTNWYPLPGSLTPGNSTNDPMIYAPYRFSVTGTAIPGYSLSDPVFLPVLNPAAAAGSRLDFNWYMQYLDKASATALQTKGCGRLVTQMDGFIVRSQVNLTLDLQESRRIFGVVGADPAAAQTWWNNNALPGCVLYGNVEINVEDWYTLMGNGKYDVVNSFEYPYSYFATEMKGTVDPTTGVTTVTIDHIAWGTDVLLARMFYWGSAGYQANYLDSTKALGWWGMELAWFEDFRFQGSLAASSFDFSLSSVMQYHFQQLSDPGPNRLYDRTDDFSYWGWGPILSDYTNDYSPNHLKSELDRYPIPPYSYVHSTPGSPSAWYGKAQLYDYAPIAWNLDAGETQRFQFPTGNVVFYNPNLTPLGANPKAGQYVAEFAPLAYMSTFPANYGSWDPVARTWAVTGPTNTGGPVGSPGPDGLPGTADDQYPLESWGGIALRPAPIEVTLNAPWSKLYVGQTMDIIATATVAGMPLPGAAAAVTVTTGGSATPISGATDANGTFKTTVRPLTGSVGTTFTVNVSVSKSPMAKGWKTWAIQSVAASTMTMGASSKTTEMMSYETAVFTMRLADASGTGLLNAQITASSPSGGNFSAAVQLGGGDYLMQWAAPKVTTQTLISINLRAKVGGYLDATQRLSLKVDPNMTATSPQHQLFVLGLSASTTPGGSVTIRAYVYTIEGYVVKGATVTPSLRFPTQGTLGPVTDELNGLYTFVYNAASSLTPGAIVTIRVDAAKAGYASGTTSVRVLIVAP